MIDPYDTERVRAVWQRVRAAHKEAISAEDFLLEAASLELERSRHCRALARQMPQLQFLAGHLERNSRLLSQMYQKRSGKSGKKPRLSPAVAREKLPFAQALGQLKGELLSWAERYDHVAQAIPELEKTLRQLARENRALSRRIPGGKP
ncbi:MAG: hypothetical protein IJC58_02885 [Oscillospiraceae bacterium]|nr:hypothetical protein [Oscillospiraceae bacterium]